LMAATMTPGTKMARNDSGLPVLSTPSPITHLSSCVFFLNKLENSDNGSLTISFRKMVPTSQPVSSSMEQMAQGRK